MKKIIRRTSSSDAVIDGVNLHPVLKRIYTARGITQAAELEHELQQLLPFQQLKDIEKAVACLSDALQQQKRVLIVGDFDADGATSSVLAVSALKAFGLQQVDFLVPNRFEYGYGLTPEIVEVAAEAKPDLIITVDNGISSCDGVAKAKQLGIDVLVTDHHLPGNTLPEAVAIINPNQHGDEFPSKNLAGVGVVFYLMLALRSHLRAENYTVPNMAQFLDLVALGTVADVVALDKNNRILVQQGLRRIRVGKCRPGILALLEVAKRQKQRLVAADLGFAIGPRLNAAGRLDDMSLGINCLLSDDFQEALAKAQALDELNQERRTIEADMQQQALQILAKLKLDDDSLPGGVCLYDNTWHQGVIGIVAGRLKDRLHRPVIAFAKVSESEIKGSARSINGVHIRDVLDAIATQQPGLITKFGGHAMAAGLSLQLENLEIFTKCFATEVEKQVDKNNLHGEILSDGELSTADLSLELAELLREAGPWGQAFPEPIFDGKFKIIEQRIVGQKHLKLVLAPTDSMGLIDAIAFNVDENQWPNHRCETVTAAYRLDVNEYRGNKKVQLIVEELLV